MTSRRDFLGILAVAPIAAPAMVKAAAAPRLASGGYVRAIDANLGAFTVSVEKFQIAAPTTRFVAGAMDDAYRRLSVFESGVDAVPNRLYGASVTAEGNAI